MGERAYQRTLERMQEVISGLGLNIFVIYVPSTVTKRSLAGDVWSVCLLGRAWCSKEVKGRNEARRNFERTLERMQEVISAGA